MRGPGREKTVAWAALAVAVCSLALSMTGVSDAVRRHVFPGASTKPRPYGILRLDKHKKFPARVIPKVSAAHPNAK